ncbi:MAG: hypothetical protein N2D54_11045, partial [Chloroflexota bacterium]
MNRRASLTFGVLLILLGGWFLAVQFMPELSGWINNFGDWPLWIIGPGILLIIAAVVSGVSGLAVPGAILSGIGGIMFYQNATNDWESWAYIWTLIIGFVGIGLFLMHILEGNFRKALKEGGRPILTSIILFLIFGSFFRYIFGEEPFLGDYWPILLILAGLWNLVKPMVSNRNRDVAEDEIMAEVVIEPDE